MLPCQHTADAHKLDCKYRPVQEVDFWEISWHMNSSPSSALHSGFAPTFAETNLGKLFSDHVKKAEVDFKKVQSKYKDKDLFPEAEIIPKLGKVTSKAFSVGHPEGF